MLLFTRTTSHDTFFTLTKKRRKKVTVWVSLLNHSITGFKNWMNSIHVFAINENILYTISSIIFLLQIEFKPYRYASVRHFLHIDQNTICDLFCTSTALLRPIRPFFKFCFYWSWSTSRSTVLVEVKSGSEKLALLFDLRRFKRHLVSFILLALAGVLVHWDVSELGYTRMIVIAPFF